MWVELVSNFLLWKKVASVCKRCCLILAQIITAVIKIISARGGYFVLDLFGTICFFYRREAAFKK
jgi:hypothetical protein